MQNKKYADLFSLFAIIDPTYLVITENAPKYPTLF